MAARLSARDIVKTALELEQTGMQTYQELMKRAPDQELSRLLDYLAREEEGHVSIFSRMFKDIELDPQSMPDPSAADSAYLEAVMHSSVFDGPRAGIKRAGQAKTPLQMLNLALQFERDAMLFWMKLHNLVREVDRPLVNKLISSGRGARARDR